MKNECPKCGWKSNEGYIVRPATINEIWVNHFYQCYGFTSFKDVVRKVLEIMPHTAIPEDELKVFASLPDIKVVFDIGARDDVDYLILKPDIELHAFEPHPVFFEELKRNVGGRKNVRLNNFALGDVEGLSGYSATYQAINTPIDFAISVHRLDTYIKYHKITQIDFLKIDTEGYELYILQGMGSEEDGYALLKICRYIQYEGGKDNEEIDKILTDNGFDVYYTGYRNWIAVRKGEPMPWIPETPQEGGLVGKSGKNYL